MPKQRSDCRLGSLTVACADAGREAESIPRSYNLREIDRLSATSCPSASRACCDWCSANRRARNVRGVRAIHYWEPDGVISTLIQSAVLRSVSSCLISTRRPF
jgi:hypothetical protein